MGCCVRHAAKRNDRHVPHTWFVLMGPMMQPIQQDFAVRYRYSVAFTEHLFDPENPILRDALNRPPNAGPVRVLFVLDVL